MKRILSILVAAAALSILLSGCGKPAAPAGEAALPEQRTGDEIVVAGRYFHTGTRVVLWDDPDGLNGYAPPPKPLSSKEPPIPGFKMGNRSIPAPPDSPSTRPVELENPDLATLQNVVDQLVLHYDGSGCSARCFSTLQHRGLSVHFMLDLDGTIYQAIDLKERAYHATTSNSRSIGVEIANIGAFPLGAPAPPMDQWYVSDPPASPGRPALKRIVVPARPEYPAPVWHDPDFIPRPARNAPVTGIIQHDALKQYDFTPQQYAALAHLTAALCRVFPQITCDYPRDLAGHLVPEKLSADDLAKYHGVLGHFHIQANKNDPGPAMQWDRLIKDARRYLSR